MAGSRAAISIDPKTLPVPALKQKILQLAAGMDRGKLQVRSYVWGCGCGCKYIDVGKESVGTDGAGGMGPYRPCFGKSIDGILICR